tara:strand:+ start:3076 stop:3636 length:561 start_codon:yes stop_codon:yes gene_type:complete
MIIIEKIQHHLSNKKYCKIIRHFNQTDMAIAKGYIVDYSENFILLQNTDDFEIDGYSIIPIETIKDILLSNNDKYYHKIMTLEGLVDKILNKHKIDLTNWSSILRSIKKLGFNVIIENEDPDDESFDIGPITKITDSGAYIRYFDAKGFLDTQSTKIKWDLITIVKFDTRYINIFSKYLRERKIKN